MRSNEVISARVPRAIKRALRESAIADGRSIAEMVWKVLMEYLGPARIAAADLASALDGRR